MQIVRDTICRANRMRLGLLTTICIANRGRDQVLFHIRTFQVVFHIRENARYKSAYFTVNPLA
jgi:hypothetical protein